MTNLYGLTQADIAELNHPEDNIHYLQLLHDTQVWGWRVDKDYMLGLLGVAYCLGRLTGRKDQQETVTFVVREE